MIDSVVIGFGYKMHSGKDAAVAEIIKQRGLVDPMKATLGYEGYRYDIRRYAFADALKREVNTAAIEAGGMLNLLTLASRRFVMCNGYYMDFPDWVQYDPDAPMDDPLCPLGKQRTLLQFWGAEFRREQDPDYWVRQLANTIELEKPQIALLSDMRFPNEMAFVQQYGETVLVDRSFTDRLRRFQGLPPSTHASETALAGLSPEEWSITIDNSGDLEEFKANAVIAFDELMTNFPFGNNICRQQPSTTR